MCEDDATADETMPWLLKMLSRAGVEVNAVVREVEEDSLTSPPTPPPPSSWRDPPIDEADPESNNKCFKVKKDYNRSKDPTREVVISSTRRCRVVSFVGPHGSEGIFQHVHHLHGSATFVQARLTV